MIEDEEHGRLDALLGTLQRKDEAQQRMEVITQLTVTAWRCATCACTTDRRRTACQVRTPLPCCQQSCFAAPARSMAFSMGFCRRGCYPW